MVLMTGLPEEGEKNRKETPNPSKRIMRKIIGVDQSDRITQQGHPSHYIFKLECGHEEMRHYSAVWKLKIFEVYLFKTGKSKINPKMNCRQCQEAQFKEN